MRGAIGFRFSEVTSLSLVAQSHHVLGGGTLLPLHDVELDALALGQRLEAAALNRRVMDETILLSILGRDEAKALGVVEPLHFASRTHVYSLLEIVLCSGCGDAVRPTQRAFVIRPSRWAIHDRGSNGAKIKRARAV